jgi:hypothetical protein
LHLLRRCPGYVKPVAEKQIREVPVEVGRGPAGRRKPCAWTTPMMKMMKMMTTTMTMMMMMAVVEEPMNVMKMMRSAE